MDEMRDEVRTRSRWSSIFIASMSAEPPTSATTRSTMLTHWLDREAPREENAGEPEHRSAA